MMDAGDSDRDSGGMHFREVLLVVLIVAVLAAMLLAGLPRSRNAASTRPDGIAATLRRIETAKHQYAADHHKQPGDPVTTKDLVGGGYLASEPIPPPGGKYVVGAAGAPAGYEDDGAPQREGAGP